MAEPQRPTWLRELLGPTAAVEQVLSGGTSRETLLVSVADRPSPLVVRRETGAGPFQGTPLKLTREAAVCEALGDSGLPVSRPVAVAPDGSAWAGTRLDGQPANEGECLDDYLAKLAVLHRHEADLSEHRGLDADGEEDREVWARLANRLRRPQPLVEAALARWRQPEHVALCHGDAGSGNYLVDGSQVTGLIDWELAHTGDPHDDLASVAIRAHLMRQDLSGFDDLVERTYRPVTGDRLDADRFLNASIGVLTRMVISCHLAMDAARDRKDRTTQVMGLPVMEVLLVKLLARADRITLPVVDPAPDQVYRGQVEELIAEGDGGDPARRRRLDYLAAQLDVSSTAPSEHAPPEVDDLLALDRAARARLAVLPSSRGLADDPLTGAPWN